MVNIRAARQVALAVRMVRTENEEVGCRCDSKKADNRFSKYITVAPLSEESWTMAVLRTVIPSQVERGYVKDSNQHAMHQLRFMMRCFRCGPH